MVLEHSPDMVSWPPNMESKNVSSMAKVPTFQECDWKSAAENSRLDLQTLPRSRGRELTEFKSLGQRGLHLCISGPYAYNNLKPILANTFLIQGLSMRKLLIRSLPVTPGVQTCNISSTLER